MTRFTEGSDGAMPLVKQLLLVATRGLHLMAVYAALSAVCLGCRCVSLSFLFRVVWPMWSSLTGILRSAQ